MPFQKSVRSKTFRCKGDHFRCHRFAKCLPASGAWSYKGRADCITFTVNKPIKLHGVQHFGSKGNKYTVCTEVKDTTQDFLLAKQLGTYASEKDETNNFYAFDLLFDRPVCLEANKQYKFVSLIKGPESWYGEEGQISVESAGGVRFTFRNSNHEGNATSVVRGQFPAYIFM